MKLPPYKIFPEIVGEDVRLRQVRTDDMKDLVEANFYDDQPTLSVEEAVHMQERIDLDYQEGCSIHWGIVDTHTDEIVGTLGYYRGFDGGVGELGCVLKTSFRGRGLMRKAMELALEFGLNTMELTDIVAITTKQNDPAVKLLERLSFVKIADLHDDTVKYSYQSTLKGELVDANRSLYSRLNIVLGC